ncbi:Alpha/Beta hydrolase protein [Collybia nuda]|uniref:Carboxylic ester hydrolase n=1 Tax=Collybia nuda TaxID=64659 RepID=A0A9P6CBK2_9AGAR|nr:Alpha/Beta hydrolase protein [Collybia nuda]
MTRNTYRFLTILLILPLARTDATPEVSTPIVDLGYATYAGSFNHTTGYTQFLGIRYAAAPTGSLRWKPPQTPPRAFGIIPAHLEPPTCFFTSQGEQAKMPFYQTTLSKRDPFFPSEDCLFLNIYTPEDISKIHKNLPVVVYIHGGGYASGSASGFTGEDSFNGNDLLRESNNGAVAVVIQYRLGVFGFLPVLNACLLDQNFALRWVQKHISKFGGDPEHVTIWGQSSGAGSVIQHIASTRAAITSSTFLPSQYKYNDPIPEVCRTEPLFVQTNCSLAHDSLDCLREVDVNALENINNIVAGSGFFGTFLFAPVVDGTFITQRPLKALEEKRVNGVDRISEIILSVTNTFEGALFVDPSTSSRTQIPTYIAQLFPTLGSSDIKKASTYYENIGSPTDQAIAIMGEAIFICPTYSLLRAFEGKSFKGGFSIPPGGHGSDVPYCYPSQNPNGVPPYNNTAFVKAFARSFLDFAMAHTPNQKSEPL